MRSRCLIVLLPVLAVTGCGHTSAPRAAATPTEGRRFEGGNPVIVRMAGRTKTLTIAASARGPVYSVAGPDGQMLLSQGSLDDLRRQHPDLYRHVRSAIVSTGEGGPAHASGEGDRDSLDYLLIGTSH